MLRDACRTLNHQASWHAVVDELREQYTFDWPRLIGTVFAHREACMLAALRALARPKVAQAGARGAKRVQFRLKLRLL